MRGLCVSFGRGWRRLGSARRRRRGWWIGGGRTARDRVNDVVSLGGMRNIPSYPTLYRYSGKQLWQTRLLRRDIRPYFVRTSDICSKNIDQFRTPLTTSKEER